MDEIIQNEFKYPSSIDFSIDWLLLLYLTNDPFDQKLASHADKIPGLVGFPKV